MPIPRNTKRLDTLDVGDVVEITSITGVMQEFEVTDLVNTPIGPAVDVFCEAERIKAFLMDDSEFGNIRRRMVG